MTGPEHRHRFTADEVLSWPEDGIRHELIDGYLLVGGEPADPPSGVGARCSICGHVR